MQIKYFSTAWNDIKNSPGWFGKLCLLALLNFIPIFGQIATYGYLYGWAREAAWGVHAPLPSKIFVNEDGKFWRRGWFCVVLYFVFGLIPAIIMVVGQQMQGVGAWSYLSGSGSGGMAGVGQLVYLVGFLGSLFMGILVWVAAIRMAIYDRLSAGFQFGKLWAMFRRDTGGILRIFGMELLVSIILGVILSIVVTVFVFFVAMVGVAGLASAGYTPNSLQYMTDAQTMQLTMQLVGSAGIAGILGFFVIVFALLVGYMFVYALVIRAVGYWTSQFDVPRWRGQDDPLPFQEPPAQAYPPTGWQ